MGEIIFITGGVRSGKSDFALKLALEQSGDTLFVATALPIDEEMMKRIKKHQAKRPFHWETVEATHGSLEKFIPEQGEILCLDCLTLYVSRRLTEKISPEKILKEVKKAIEKIKVNFKLAIMVSNEVGWGLVPETSLGREFQDTLGRINQLVASLSDQVFLIICGIHLRLK